MLNDCLLFYKVGLSFCVSSRSLPKVIKNDCGLMTSKSVLFAFGIEAPVVSGRLPHVGDHPGDGVVVVVNDVDAGSFPVSAVFIFLTLKHQIEVQSQTSALSQVHQ